MDDLRKIAEAEIEGFRSGFSLKETDNGFLIDSPMILPDGEKFHIVCCEIDGKTVLTDKGHTIGWLIDQGIEPTRARMRILEEFLGYHWVDLRDGELVIECNPNGGWDLAVMLKAIMHVADLCYLNRRHVRSTFVEDVRSVLSRRIPYCETDKILSDPLGDEYRTDAFIGGEHPVMVFAVRSKDRCKDVTLALMALHSLGYESVVVLDEGNGIPRKDLDRLEKRSDHTVGLKDLPALADSIAASRRPGKDAIHHSE